MEEIRLQKFLAESGVASRRKCEEYILQGKVKVNGVVVEKLGTKINPQKDEVEFAGKKMEQHRKKKIYLLLNKPIGYVTTVKDPFSRKTVLDLVKHIDSRIVPVGRLDMYTSGALILTNDGDLVYHVTHPSKEIEKTYQVTIKGMVTQEEVKSLEKGVDIGEYITKPAKVRMMKIDSEKHISRVEIVIHEGKNRQVRKMCEAVGKKVLALHRSKIGNISVKDLKIGQFRYLTQNEINYLKK